MPSTARQTVSGVDSSRPSVPQSQVQNIAATSRPRAETPGRLAVDDRLQEAVQRDLDHREEGDDLQRLRPAREVGEREDQRQDERHRRPDVGDEPQQRRQAAPEHRVGHADRPQPQPDDQPEARVDQRERRQVAADPLADLLHRPGRQADLAVAEEADDPVAEVLAAHQHEQDQDQHEAADAEEFQVGADGPLEPGLTSGCSTTSTLWIGKLPQLFAAGLSSLAEILLDVIEHSVAVECSSCLKTRPSLVSMLSL